MGQKRKENRGKLTSQQEKFCQHYALNQSGADAYRHAYPASKKWKPNTFHPQVSRTLADPKIAARIRALEAKASEIAEKKFEVTVEKITQELAAIAFANADDYYSWGSFRKPLFTKSGAPIIDPKTGEQRTEIVPFVHIKDSAELTRQQKAAIAGAEMTFSKTGDPVISVKMSDKRAALKDLGQTLGMFKMGLDANVAGKGGGPIQLVVSSAEDAL